jgi:predicted DNA-binding transcriptional regulator AlpA
MDTTKNIETLFLTAKQCAVRYNISLRQFQVLVKRGDVPQPIAFGGSKRWSIRALEDFELEQINRQSAFFERTSRHCKKKRR